MRSSHAHQISMRLVLPALLSAALAACQAPAQVAGQPPAQPALADGAPEVEPLPMTPAVTTGTLDNGLRYFIQRNDEPEQRAFLRLVVDAGSVLEDDDARGVAHFLEHMAFNGTERFEKQELVSFMESIGMRLGAGLNASTSFDETIYMLSVPTDTPEPLQRAFDVLEDWARGLTLESDEIDQERGVVLEEWRGGQGAAFRVRDSHMPVLFRGSRYAERLPIGTAESIRALGRSTLERFYRDWYRPELMAVVAVGDFDPAEVENLIRHRFANLPASTGDAPARAAYTVPGHDETLVSIVSDPEVPTATVQLVHKMLPDDDWTVAGYRRRLVEQLYNGLLSLRLQEIARRPDAPFLTAGSETTRPIRPSRVYSLTAIAPEDGIDLALQTLLDESERVARFGFTETELERGKSALLRAIERRYATRDDVQSPVLAAQYTESFLTGRPIPDIEHELELHRRFLPDVSLAEVNAVGARWLGGTSRVVLVTAPEKDGLTLPSEAALTALLDDDGDRGIEGYVDTIVDGILIDELPAGAPVIAERERAGGVIEWNLENGVRVVLMPTDFNSDQVLFRGFSPGGTSLASDDDLTAARTALPIAAAGGLGKHDLSALQRTLSGKLAAANPFVTDGEEGIAGQASTQDLQTLFELIHLRFTAPRADAAAFALVQNQLRLALANRDSNPAVALEDAFNRLMTQDHPRSRPITADVVDEMSLERSIAFYRDRFGDASDFTFVFVGDFDLESIRPLTERFLGGLPASGRNDTWRDHGLRLPEGAFDEVVRKGIEPRSQTRIAFNGEIELDDPTQRLLMVGVSRLLETHFRNVLREDLGGTYGVAVQPRMRRLPAETYALIIEFGSDPDRAEELVARIFAELADLERAGFDADRVADVRESLLREHETSVRQNAYWLAALTETYAWHPTPGPELILAEPERIAALNPDTAHDALRRFIDSDNYVRVTLMPER